jgi:hypothetical protein
MGEDVSAFVDVFSNVEYAKQITKHSKRFWGHQRWRHLIGTGNNPVYTG